METSKMKQDIDKRRRHEEKRKHGKNQRRHRINKSPKHQLQLGPIFSQGRYSLKQWMSYQANLTTHLHPDIIITIIIHINNTRIQHLTCNTKNQGQFTSDIGPALLCCRTLQYSGTFTPFSVSLWNDLVNPVFDGVGLVGFKSRANASLLA